jgi:hypothetical protein
VSIETVRTALADFFDEQARWREGRADEHPHDRRNATSATALTDLAHYVRSLPDSDRRLEALAGITRFVMPTDVLMPGEEATRIASRHGFHQPADPNWRAESESEFLDRFVAACQHASSTFDDEQLEEAATSEGALDALDEFEA